VKKILLAVLSAFCLSIFLYPDLLEINTFELPNGLRVIFSPDPNMEAVAVCVYFQHGVRSDPPDVLGGSYLYQNLMFLGTENFEPYDHVLFVNKVGGVIGGRVNYDNSFFYQVVPAS
jgi:zinc protease